MWAQLLDARGAYDRSFTLFPCLLDWTGNIMNPVCLETKITYLLTDDDVEALRNHVSEKQSVFNTNRRKSVQYPLTLDSLSGPLGEKMGLLRHFLVCAFQECTPHDWVCLHSLPNCLEQHPHSDYVREDVEEAVAIHGARGYPFECQFSICDVFISCLTSFYVLS